MAGPSDADYVCRLDDETLRKAIEELKEDPKNRIGAVQTFRQWLTQQRHISCPDDIDFLLPFLRVRYFSQLEARKLLENFWTRRTKFPQWFRNLDTVDPKLQAIFDAGIALLIPNRDDEGRQIAFIRPGRIDYKSTKYTKHDVLRAIACLIDFTYLTDEMTLVNGTVTVIDMGGYSFANEALTVEERRDFMHTWQSHYPARVKQIHFYNTGGFMDLMLGLIKIVVPEKIQKRVKMHGQVLESLYKDIPQRLLPSEYLPDDYTGPDAGTEQQIIEWTKEQLTSPRVRDRIRYLSQEKWGIDESKRPQAGDRVPEASFRKLNLDD